MTTTPVAPPGLSLRELVAEEVRVALARKRMSASKLARELNVSQTYIWRRLKGETAFDLDDLERISLILGVPVIALLNATGPSPGEVNMAKYGLQTERPTDNRPKRRPTARPERPGDNRPKGHPADATGLGIRRPRRIGAPSAATQLRNAA